MMSYPTSGNPDDVLCRRRRHEKEPAELAVQTVIGGRERGRMLACGVGSGCWKVVGETLIKGLVEVYTCHCG